MTTNLYTPQLPEQVPGEPAAWVIGFKDEVPVRVALAPPEAPCPWEPAYFMPNPNDAEAVAAWMREHPELAEAVQKGPKVITATPDADGYVEFRSAGGASVYLDCHRDQVGATLVEYQMKGWIIVLKGDWPETPGEGEGGRG